MRYEQSIDNELSGRLNSHGHHFSLMHVSSFSRARSHRHAANGGHVHQVGDEVDDPSQLADLPDADGGNVADAR